MFSFPCNFCLFMIFSYCPPAPGPLMFLSHFLKLQGSIPVVPLLNTNGRPLPNPLFLKHSKVDLLLPGFLCHVPWSAPHSTPSTS